MADPFLYHYVSDWGGAKTWAHSQRSGCLYTTLDLCLNLCKAK